MVFIMKKADASATAEHQGEKRKGIYGETSRASKKTQRAPAAASLVQSINELCKF